MSFGKIALILGFVAVLTVVGATLYLVSSLDSIVKNGIERYGREMTGTSVHVDSVSISLRSGRGSIRGVRVANPPGYSPGDAFSLGEITLQIDVASLAGSPIAIDEVRIAAPAVKLEIDARGRSNMETIQSNVERYTGSETPAAGGDAPAAGDAPEAEAGAPTLFAVKKFIFEDGVVKTDARAIGGPAIEVELPALRLSNLGGSAGAPADQIGREVTIAFGGAAARTATTQGVKSIVDKHLGGDAKKAADSLLRMLDR